MPARTWNYAPVDSTHDVLRRVAQKARNNAKTLSDCLRPTGTAAKLCPASGPNTIPIAPPPIINTPLLMSADDHEVAYQSPVSSFYYRLTDTLSRQKRTVPSDLQLAFEMSKEHLGLKATYHRVRVALTLTEYQADDNVIIASFLVGIEPAIIKEHFGQDIAALAQGAAELDSFAYNQQMEESETSAAQKAKVILARVKQAPLAASHILEAVAKLHQLKIAAEESATSPAIHELAQETLHLQAEMLARLNYNKLAADLVDISMYHLDPDTYTKATNTIETRIGKKRIDSEIELEELTLTLDNRIKAQGITCRSLNRQKAIARIIQKEQREGGWENITDYWAMRFICQKESDIYNIRDTIITFLAEDGWEIVQNDEINYVSKPKSNGYQSYHLHFRHKESSLTLNIQIRTEEMDLQAELGPASHWTVYKQGLAGVDPTKLDGQLKRMGENHKETLDMRWEFLKKMANKFSFAYVVNVGHKPTSPQDKSQREFLAELGWEKTKLVAAYIGEDGRELIPHLMDIALATNDPKTGVCSAYFIDEKGWVNDDRTRNIHNGEFVYLNTNTLSKIKPEHAKQAVLPYYQALANAALIQQEEKLYYFTTDIPSESSIIEAMESLENEINAKLTTADPAFSFPKGESPATKKTFMNIDLASKIAGYGSEKTLWFLLAISNNKETILAKIMERLYPKVEETMVHCQLIRAKSGETSLYVLPENDQQGTLWFITTCLAQNDIDIKTISILNQESAVKTKANKRGFCFVVDNKGKDLLSFCSEFAYLKARLPENFTTPASCSPLLEGQRYTLYVTSKIPYNELLPEIFMATGRNQIKTNQIITPRQEQAEPSEGEELKPVTVSIEFKVKKGGWGLWEPSAIKRCRKELKLRLEKLGDKPKIAFSAEN